MRRRLPKPTTKQRGTVAVMAALLLPLMMALAAFAIDIGSVYAHRRALQNASDAAALAGAREALQLQFGSTTADPHAKALDFAKRNGIDMAGSACRSDGKATLSSSKAGTNPQTWSVTTSRQVALTFGSFVGTSSLCVQASAEAKASSDMLDIMLSLDTTKSMELSGTEDFQHLRNAVTTFINTVNPDPNNTRTSKIGLARWAGIQCHLESDWDYVNPCYNDLRVLSNLSTDKANLVKLASGNSSGCPTLPSQPPNLIPASPQPGSTKWACPLKHASYDHPNSGGYLYPDATGTKIPNAFFSLNNNNSSWSSTNNAWSTNKGGRTDAKKIMVLFTDGKNEAWPRETPQDPDNWDSEATTLANMFKSQGIEIYVVGFFCPDYGSGNYCTSRLVDSPGVCPGAWTTTVNSIASPIDKLLKNLSSSASGTCDHYYPLAKSDNGDDLPELFQSLASRLTRVRLTS